MRPFFVALRALVYMTGFVLFWGWIALSAREFDPSFGVLLPAWTETLGIIFMPVGGLLALTCAAVFIARGRGPIRGRCSLVFGRCRLYALLLLF